MNDILLRLAGCLGILTAIVHAFQGDVILRGLALGAPELAFVRATHQLGAMGWMAGGVLLIAAPSMTSRAARSWITGVFIVVYGVPTLGNFALNGGQPRFGWMALGATVVLTILGRRAQPQMEKQP